ncbi:MAG: hypothetical protein BJ554DRAFT_2375, partial [Olpidium bornovanus]
LHTKKQYLVVRSQDQIYQTAERLVARLDRKGKGYLTQKDFVQGLISEEWVEEKLCFRLFPDELRCRMVLNEVAGNKTGCRKWYVEKPTVPGWCQILANGTGTELLMPNDTGNEVETRLTSTLPTRPCRHGQRGLPRKELEIQFGLRAVGFQNSSGCPSWQTGPAGYQQERVRRPRVAALCTGLLNPRPAETRDMAESEIDYAGQQEFDDQLVVLDEEELQNEPAFLASDTDDGAQDGSESEDVEQAGNQEESEAAKDTRKRLAELYATNKFVAHIRRRPRPLTGFLLSPRPVRRRHKCFHNNITQDRFVRSAVTSLEMCHYTFPKILGIKYFKNLRSLTIIAQQLALITGLDQCEALEDLWICETLVTKIAGLRSKPSPHEISGREVQAPSAVKRSDEIVALKLFTVPWMTLVQELNVAGNQLFSFVDVLNLTSLPALTSLSLADPNFANNPICALCNYQTHLIYHLPRLTFLDTLEVPMECRKIIAGTVTKKRMYVMSRKTVSRGNSLCPFSMYAKPVSCGTASETRYCPTEMSDPGFTRCESNTSSATQAT